MKHSALFGIILIMVLLPACTPEEKAPTTIEAAGVVTNSVTKKPIEGVTLTDGDTTVVTDQMGEWTLETDPGVTLAISHCGYDGVDIKVEAAIETVSIDPNEVTVVTISNLTGKPIKASAGRLKSDRRGTLTFTAVCPGQTTTVRSPGYEALKISPLEEDVVELEAGPAVTLKQMGLWSSRQLWKRTVALTHPSTLVTITRKELIAANREDATEGYQAIRYEIKKTRMVTWTHSACVYSDFGPRTFKRTAAIENVYVQATPSGGVRRFPGVTHLVQTKDGLWRWFPTLGCDYAK